MFADFVKESPFHYVKGEDINLDLFMEDKSIKDKFCNYLEDEYQKIVF